MADYSDVFAIVTKGLLLGQHVFICSTLDDGMCVCNIGQDEFGETRYTQIPKEQLRVIQARPLVRDLVGQTARLALHGTGTHPCRDWTWIHPLLSRAL
jgi:hypothetical protein